RSLVRSTLALTAASRAPTSRLASSSSCRRAISARSDSCSFSPGRQYSTRNAATHSASSPPSVHRTLLYKSACDRNPPMALSWSPAIGGWHLSLTVQAHAERHFKLAHDVAVLRQLLGVVHRHAIEQRVLAQLVEEIGQLNV